MLIKRWGKALFAQKPHQTDPNSNNGAAPTAPIPAPVIDNAVWAIRSTYHTVLKASPGAAIFGRDMLFDIPFVADWNKIGE